MTTTTVDIEAIAEAGVVGAGGAGFPTHVKLAGKADTVLINAAECEPLLHKDKEVLRAYVDDVLEGTGRRPCGWSGPARGVVGIKEKYHDVIDLLRSKLPASMDVAPLRDAYPAGDEFILVYDVLRPRDSAGRHSAGRRRRGDERRDGDERRPARPISRSPRNTSPSPAPWPSR